MAAGPLTLSEVIELGEYEPEVLAKYPEWEKLSNYARFQLITRGLETRRRQLFKKWSEVVNFIGDFPSASREETKTNLERQLQQLRADKERLYNEYSKLT